MSAAILMLQKEGEEGKKEGETPHQTPLTNALANINALLIHPICRLIAFLYTVIWHLLLKSGVGSGEAWEKWCGGLEGVWGGAVGWGGGC